MFNLGRPENVGFRSMVPNVGHMTHKGGGGVRFIIPLFLKFFNNRDVVDSK